LRPGGRRLSPLRLSGRPLPGDHDEVISALADAERVGTAKTGALVAKDQRAALPAVLCEQDLRNFFD
jgi:hypothetical protein